MVYLPHPIRSLRSANDFVSIYKDIRVTFMIEKKVRSPSPILVKNDFLLLFATTFNSYLLLRTGLVSLLRYKTIVAMFLFQNHPT